MQLTMSWLLPLLNDPQWIEVAKFWSSLLLQRGKKQLGENDFDYFDDEAFKISYL